MTLLRRCSIAIASVALVPITTALAEPVNAEMTQRGTREAKVSFELRLAEEQPGPGLVPKRLAGSDVTIYVRATPLVKNEDVVAARMQEGDAEGEFQIILAFGPEASDRVENATQGHVGKAIAIMIDGEVMSAPMLSGPLRDHARITGAFTRQEAEDIVAAFNRAAKERRPRGGV